MVPPSNRRLPRWMLILGLQAVGAFAALPGATGAPSRTTQVDDRKQRADDEFNAGRAAVKTWCEQLAAAQREHADDLVWTLRLAQCERINSGTETALALLAQATNRAGAEAVAKAQAILDAGLGAAAASAEPSHLEIEQHWAKACEHFQRSLELDPSPGTQLAVAMCHLRGGKLQLARVMVAAAHSALAPLDGDDAIHRAQLQHVRWLSAELERLQPSVLLRAHAGYRGTVRLAAKELAAGPPLLLDPGSYPVSAELHGTAGATQTLTATPGQRLELRIDEPRRILDTPRKLLVWGGLGVGAASAATAGIMYWRAQNKWSALERAGCKRSSSLGGEVDCPAAVPTDQPDSYNRTIDVFQIGGAAALLLFTTSAVTYFTVPRTEALRIVPLAAGQRTGAALAGSF